MKIMQLEIIANPSKEAQAVRAMIAKMYMSWGAKHGMQVQGFVESNHTLGGFQTRLLIRGLGACRLRHEGGLHRVVRVSPFDDLGRRHTSFAVVVVNDQPREGVFRINRDESLTVRSYVLDPYQLVKDFRTSMETNDVAGVFGGDIDRFLPKR